jgi:hypothetical protein
MANRGRPAKGDLHKRTVAFPPDLYERIRAVAKREDRDVTSQIIRMLRESLERLEGKGNEPGPIRRTALEGARP